MSSFARTASSHSKKGGWDSASKGVFDQQSTETPMRCAVTLM